MAHLHRSLAALRIHGEDLEPSEISSRLGCAPTMSQRKGDVFTNKTTGSSRTARYGAWHLDALDREPEDLDGQIAELLGKLTSDLSVWASIAARYEVDLFCGFFMQRTDEGVEISVESLKALSERGIELGICLYAPTKEDLERYGGAA
jgi:Domain of unknown function (DUF4279)